MPAPRPTPAPTIADQRIPLPDGSQLTITGTVPGSAADRRAAVRGSQLYLIAGWLDRTGGPLAGYLGKSSVLYSTRAASSYTRWVKDQARIRVFGMALIHREEPYPPDLLTVTESFAISKLSAPGNYAMLNTHSAANVAARRLTRNEVVLAQNLADTLVTHIERHLYLDEHNPANVHASNMREAAVRRVLAADRALDTAEIVEQLADTGHTSTAQRPDYSVRRDLVQRETVRGTPRIFTTTHRGRRIYWPPQLSKRDAIQAYDQAHPPTNPAMNRAALG